MYTMTYTLYLHVHVYYAYMHSMYIVHLHIHVHVPDNFSLVQGFGTIVSHACTYTVLGIVCTCTSRL